MEEILLLVDYKGYFGTKHGAIPYRSGLDREKLAQFFQKYGFRATFLSFSDVDFRKSEFKNRWVLYSSAEDHDLHYKSFIEDIVLGLERVGAKVLPPYEFLRAHHNKVFMEILRNRMAGEGVKSLCSRSFGSLEELESRIETISLPCVVKPAAGSMSQGVDLCRTRDELMHAAARVSSSRHWVTDAWDVGRRLRRRGYVRESTHRRKFIVQPFIEGLTGDWKVLVYGTKYFVLMRGSRKRDFRASGSGHFEFVADVPPEVLNLVASIRRQMDVPHLSADVASAEGRTHLFEFQALHFGTLTIERAPFHFVESQGAWNRVDGASDLEEEFVRSTVEYMSGRGASLS